MYFTNYGKRPLFCLLTDHKNAWFLHCAGLKILPSMPGALSSGAVDAILMYLQPLFRSSVALCAWRF